MINHKKTFTIMCLKTNRFINHDLAVYIDNVQYKSNRLFTTYIPRWARHSGRAWTRLDASRCCVVNRGHFGYDCPLLADIDLLTCCGLPCLYEATKTEVQGWNHWGGCFAIRQRLGVVVVQGADHRSARRDCLWGNCRYEGQRGADHPEVSRIA